MQEAAKALKRPIGSCFPLHSSRALATSCALYNRAEQAKLSLFVKKHQVLLWQHIQLYCFDLSINQVINKVKLEAGYVNHVLLKSNQANKNSLFDR